MSDVKETYAIVFGGFIGSVAGVVGVVAETYMILVV